MMFYYVKANKELFSKLSNKHYSVEQLDYMHHNLQLQVNSKRHLMKRMLYKIALSAILLIMGIISLFYLDYIDRFFFIIGLYLILGFILVSVSFLWFFIYGKIIRGFNQGLKKGYPELIEKYKLK